MTEFPKGEIMLAWKANTPIVTVVMKINQVYEKNQRKKNQKTIK